MTDIEYGYVTVPISEDLLADQDALDRVDKELRHYALTRQRGAERLAGPPELIMMYGWYSALRFPFWRYRRG